MTKKKSVEPNPVILETAERLFKTLGYNSVLMADIATEAKIALPAVQTHFHDKKDILIALLDKRSPRDAIRSALRQLRTDTPENMVRDAISRMVEVFNDHTAFVDLIILDIQVNEGGYLTLLFNELAGEAASFINRLSTMPGTRPISSIMLGRAFASLIAGFVATQHIAPRSAQFAMRIFPPKAWVEGVADIFLYGILESEE